MNQSKFFQDELDEISKVIALTAISTEESFLKLVRLCSDSVNNGGKILFFGNGGSAADSQHLAAELVVRYQVNRQPIPAIALTTDTSVLSAAANDYGYEQVFARQIQALGQPGDVAIGISTSGNSKNVINGLRAAKQKDIIAAGFSGGDGGQLIEVADPLIVVPSSITARIQEVHIILGHVLCSVLEEQVDS